MTREEFEQQAAADGFDLAEAAISPNTERPPHTHPFEARLFILDGVFTLVTGDSRASFHPGEVCGLAADTVHQEVTGPEGARYLGGRRTPARAAA